MARDTKKWNQGIARLSGFMQHIPSSISEECVEQYHQIVSMLEEASEEDLSTFRIPAARLAQRITRVVPGGHYGGPGEKNYSREKYCDYFYFTSQVHGLANYVRILVPTPVQGKDIPYDSLTDDQIQDLMMDRKIKPKRNFDSPSRPWVFDRAHAIAELRKLDLEAPVSVSNVYNIRDSNIVNGSPGASITQSVGVKGDELRKLIGELKEFADASKLPEADREQIKVDIGTIELQCTSPQPNDSVIRSRLESVMRIVENAMGVVTGECVIVAIKHYLGLK